MTAPDSLNPPGNPGNAPGNDERTNVFDTHSIEALAAAVAEAMKRNAAEESLLKLAAVLKDGVDMSDVPGGIKVLDPKPSALARFSPRMLVCLLVAAILSAVVALIAPQQVPVMASKLALVSVSGYLGYWMDRWIFPYSRPDGYLCRNWKQDGGAKEDAPDHAVVPGYEMVFAITQIRRAAIIVGVMIAIGLGL